MTEARRGSIFTRLWRRSPLPEPIAEELPPWRLGPEPSPTARGRRNRAWRFGVLALMLAIFGVLLVQISLWFRPPRPADLVLVEAGYADNLAVPANVADKQGMHELADWARPEPGKGLAAWFRRARRLQLRAEPVELYAGGDWSSNLSETDKTPVVLFLALHGGADPDGAYLLPNNADACNTKTNRLRVKDVIDRLAHLPPSASKLLVLDATQVTANWPLGLIHNDFARALDQLEPRIQNVPNLIVLSASDLNQRSWMAEEYRQSIFTHCVIEGLKGAADENQDQRINALELCQYVQRTVQDWARIHRAARQTPVLLPRGEEGERRARAMHLSLVEAGYQPPAPRTVDSIEPPALLVEAWRRYQELSRSDPPPAANAPHLWRQYQATLLRLEELLREGDPASAKRLSEGLRDLERDMRASARLDLRADLSCITQTLALPTTVGILGESPRAGPVLAELRATAPADRAKIWAALRAAAGDGREQLLLQIQALALLLKEAAKEPTAAGLAGDADLVQVLCDGLPIRPVEAHFAIMLRHDLTAAPALRADLTKYVAHALRLRPAAERAVLGAGEWPEAHYPYSEQIVNWLAADVTDADRLRRQGEDLLFSDSPKDWQTADRFFTKAESAYHYCQAKGAEVRAAVVMRDELFARLPGYSRWLALRRPPTDLAGKRAAEDELQRTEVLWAMAHGLADQLQSWPMGSVDELARATAKARRAFADLVGRYTAFANNLVRDPQDTDAPTFWEDLQAARAVADPDLELRMKLWRQEQRGLQRLVERSNRGQAGPAEVTPEQTRERAVDHARRQGRLAMAYLGSSWFDSVRGQTGETAAVVRFRLNEFAGQADGWDWLVKAGDEIGRRFCELPKAINRRLQVSADTDPSKEADLQKEAVALLEADRFGRLLDGTNNGHLTDSPTEAARRWRYQQLLLQQARRTLAGHWYSDDDRPGAVPYYRSAGLAFAHDARGLIPRSSLSAAHAQIQRLEVALKSPDTEPFPAVRTPKEMPRLIGDRATDLTYRIDPQAVPPAGPGYPVFWLSMPGSLTASGAPERRPQPLAGAAQEGPLSFHVGGAVSPTEDDTTAQTGLAQMVLHGLFRGRPISLPAPVRLAPAPDLVISQPPPPVVGRLALRTDDHFGPVSGAVAIVLDCSGSMGEERLEDFSPNTKYNQAVAALRKVLSDMPAGTLVSVWTFGQRGTDPQAAPESTIEAVRRLAPWKPTDLGALLASVEVPNRVPWNLSPIVRSMIRAKQELVTAPVNYKALVVITDGLDNRFDQDAQFNPDGLPIPTMLRRELGGAGIVVSVLALRVPRGEQEKSRAQFAAVTTFDPPGRYVPVEGVATLVEELRKALRQRQRPTYELAALGADDKPRPLQWLGPRGLSAPGSNDLWSPDLPAGRYRVTVRSEVPVQRDLLLAGGDLLLLRHVNAGDRLFVEPRVPKAGAPEPALARAPGWSLALAQDQLLAPRQLQMLALLAPPQVPDREPIRLIRPKQVWFEVRPAELTDEPFSLRWAPQLGYPAPAWSLQVPRWPLGLNGQPVRPKVQVWWSLDAEAGATPLPRSALPDKTFQGAHDVAVTAGGEPVKLEGVTVETQRVLVRPGVTEARQCIVVRLNWDRPGTAFWASLTGLGELAVEHRFYRPAGRYVGVFWRNGPPLTVADVKDRLEQLNVYSLAAFQKTAQDRGFTAILDNCPEPRQDDARPPALAPLTQVPAAAKR